MKSLAKSFLLLCVGVTILATSSSAFADTKEWQGTKPVINVQSPDADFKFLVDLDFEVNKRDGVSSYHQGMATTFPGDKANFFLNDLIHVPEGTTLTFNVLTFKSTDGTVLPNCNMLENPAFQAGASEINITVTPKGCLVN